ncbi:MAG TPA: response regulator [Acidimicrobiales bacterium]|jgi:DNA-binding NarL/FixJ family response regulator|nr:response regulator [Acidimicrobiales bacterium]
MTRSAQLLRTVVVDDSTDLRDLLRIALTRSGRFDVVGEAADATTGVDVVRTTRPELLLLDLGMPGIGGLDALPLVRAASPETTVVVISGYPRDGLEQHVSARGAAGYVEKGLSVKALVDQIIATAGVLQLVTSALAEERTELDQDLRSGSRARRFVSEAMERWDCAGALDTVQLLVSELVTNAVVHAGSRPNVAVLLLPHAVRVEVADQAPEGLRPRDATDADESGRGLFLLDELSSAWGVDTSDDGKTVWFEVPRFDG